MPSMDSWGLVHTAVLQPATGQNDEFGQPRVGDPVEIQCRWNESQSESLDAAGNTVALDSTALVDRRVPLGSRLWLGTLADWNAGGGAAVPSGLMEVKTYSQADDIRGRDTVRNVGMVHFRDAQ